MSDYDIPSELLPPGFAETVDQDPVEPAPARPAATVVLLRDQGAGPEVLLLRRTRSSGFVPGAYVFPGGRVDPADAAEPLLAHLDGLTAGQAAERLGLPHPPGSGRPDPLAYYLAAVREAFEETGILIGHGPGGAALPTAHAHPQVESLRSKLLDDQVDFAEVLATLQARLAGDRVVYLAHWITPIQEPRRYDTRFFLAEVPAGSESVIDPREMTDALWLRPLDALDLNRRGRLPMVFPTIHTLERLEPYRSAAEAMRSVAERAVPAILPRLVRTPTGVGIEVPKGV